MNEIHVLNCSPKLVKCNWKEQYSVTTQHVLPQIVGLKMSNFNLYVMISDFRGILGDPEFWAIHVGLSHCIALAGYS